MAAADMKLAEEDLKSFLSFFELKRRQYSQELSDVIHDVLLERVVEDMFSRDDVEGLFEAAAESAQAKAELYLEKQINMAALVIEQVYTAALDAGVRVSLDMSRVEDEKLLREVGKLNEERLTALREAQAGQLKLAQLGARKGMLEEQLDDLQAQVTELKAANAKLEADNAALRGQLASSGGSGGSAAPAEVEALRTALAARETELAEARAMLSGLSAEAAAANERITSTRQFQQMRDMLHKKNATIAQLRGRLLAHDPTAFDDDADAAAGGVVHK